MNDEQLKLFCKVAETRSFSKAEETSYVSKQAILKQINKLEDEIGCALFLRSRGGVTLTDAGQVFYEGAKKLLDQKDQLIDSCRAVSGDSPVLRIGTVEHQVLLSPVTEAFTKQFPHIRIERVIHPNHGGEWRVANRIQDVAETFDLAVAFFEKDRANWPNAYLPLTTVPYVAAMRSGHPLEQMESVSLKELSLFRLIVFEPMVGPERVKIIQTIFRVSPDHLLLRTDVDHQVETAYECLASDQILLTANPFIHSIKELIKVPLQEGWTREYGITYLEPANAAVKNYIETAIKIYHRS